MSVSRRLLSKSAMSVETTAPIVEYTFSTEPEWISDAVICTPTGVEINFDKLNRLCSPELLPKEISLTLHSTASSVASSVPSPSSSVTDNLYSSSGIFR